MKIFKVLILIFLFISFVKIKAEALTISPSVSVLETEPGGSGTITIQVYNDGRNSRKIKAYVWDIGFSNNGQTIYKPVGSFNYSTARYMKIVPENFTVEPFKTKEVKISMETPPDFTGGNQAVAFFEVIADAANSTNPAEARISMGVRLGAIILQETKGKLNRKSRIKEINIIPPKDSKPLTLNMGVINEGNTHVFASAEVAIMSEDYTKFIGKLSLPKLLLFQTKEATLKGTWKGKILPGRYHALITYQYGEDKNIVIDKVFNIQ